jgi:hypothetical protein
MVLDSAIENDQFNSSDNPDAYGSPRAYPPHPSIPTFLGFNWGLFSEQGKQRFNTLYLNLAEREFGFRPNPIEKEGLEYYNAVFYATEARGSLYGTLGGVTIGAFTIRRQRNPGFLFREMGKFFRVQPRLQLLASRTVNLILIATIGRLYGITSSGVSAFNRTRKEQEVDPNMRRYLAMRNEWVNIKAQNSRLSGPQKPVINDIKDVKELASKFDENQTGQKPDDANSLGGLDFYTEKNNQEESASLGNSGSDIGTRTARQQPSRVSTTEDTDDDPFFGSPSEQTPKSQPTTTQKSWENTQPQASGSMSAWDRIRLGEKSMGSGRNTDESPAQQLQRQSRWSSKPQMKGFDKNEQSEDSVAFSSTEVERAVAKEEAQKQFDEKVQKERQGDGHDGFVNDIGQGRHR